MAGDLTPGQVRQWDASAIQQVFQVVKNRDGTYKDFGDTLGSVQQQLSDWGGEAGDAFHQEMGHHRQHIDTQGRISPGIAAAVEQAETDVNACKTELAAIGEAAAKYNWQIPDQTWMVDYVHNPNDPDGALPGLEERLAALKVKATNADHELAQAMRAAVGDVQLDSHGHEQPQQPSPAPQPAPTPDASGKVPGPDGDPPYGNGATPTMIPGAKNIPLADNPPGYNGAAGPQRDQAWKDYLNNTDHSRQVGDAPAVLPKPEAVQDKSLRVIGAAARQQGVSYAWGGNRDLNGPSPGHKATHAEYPGYTDEQLHNDGSWTSNDDQRVGFDCGGLVRFSYHEGAGIDLGQGTNAIDSTTALQQVKGGVPGQLVGQYAQPGDVFVYGNNGHAEFANGGTHHTGIYLGNGVIINAPESGEPVDTAKIGQWQGQPTDILRVPTP